MTKILIVEDEEMLRNAYVNIFSIEKFKVAEARNGKIALDIIDKIKPQIIVLDILMPVMNGIEFLQQLNKLEKYPTLKILVLSNLSDKATIDKVAALGATKHLVKASLSPKELVNAVKQLLK